VTDVFACGSAHLPSIDGKADLLIAAFPPPPLGITTERGIMGAISITPYYIALVRLSLSDPMRTAFNTWCQCAAQEYVHAMSQHLILRKCADFLGAS